MYYFTIISFLAFSVGIFFGLKIDFSTEIFLLALFLATLNIFIYKFSKRTFGIYKSKIPIYLFLFFCFLGIGIVVGQFTLNNQINKKENFQTYLENLKTEEKEKYTFTGYITDLKNKESSQEFILNIENQQKEKYKILIRTNIFPRYKTGEFLEVNGKIKTENLYLIDFENQKTKEIQSVNIFENYLLKNISGESSFPKIKILSQEKKNLKIYLENLKNKFINILENRLNYFAGSLSVGTFLGENNLFSKEDLNKFREVGLSHIIVLSGYNISLLIYFFLNLFLIFRLGLGWRIFLSILMIVVFIIFVGAGASILRAGIMGMILLLATFSGRKYLAKQGLFLSAFIMLCLNPNIILYDISFHLSFLATFGILYFYERINRIIENNNLLKIKKENLEKENELEVKNKKLKINFLQKISKNILEVFKLSLILQIFLLPYLLYQFGQISFLSVFLNILILPFVPIIMLFAFLILIFSFSKILIFPFVYLENILSKIIFVMVDFFSKINFLKIENYISIESLLFIYFIYFLLYNILKYYERFQRKNLDA